jgi:hypothetical protein
VTRSNLPAPMTVALGQLEVVGRNGGFLLVSRGQPVLTPGGAPLTHPEARLLEHVRREAERSGELRLTELSAFSMLCTQLDFVDQGEDVVATDFHHALLHDPLLYRQPGPEGAQQLGLWEPAVRMLGDWGLQLPIAIGGAGCHGVPTDPQRFEAFAEALKQRYLDLRPEQRTGVINLFQAARAGVILPMSLVLGRATPLELAEALVVAWAIHPTVFNPADEGEYLEKRDAVRAMAAVVQDYVDHYRSGS